MPTFRCHSPEMGGRRGLYGFVLFFAAVLLRVHDGHALNQTCDANDLAALRAFYDGLDGKGAGWGGGGSCCSWTGVSCHLGRVVGLDLSNQSLRGVISPSLASLHHLATLNLSRNSLRGQALPGLAALPGLRLLDLSANTLSGAFPSSGGDGIFFPAIEVLNVSFNEFAGPHPTFPGATNLTVLDFSRNALSGSINATALCGAAPLSVLRLSGNAFSGGIPAGFGRCEVLAELCLDANGLTGSLPGDLFEMPGLQTLSLQENSLSGGIDNLGNLSQLVHIDLSYNRFTGFIPDIFGGLRRLESLNLASNGFDGTLPGSLSSCPTLSVLVLSNNSLSGEIALDFSLLPRLNNFDAGTNKLSGAIPAGLAWCAELRKLNLARNKLEGEIPESFKNLTSLLYLSLTGNGFTNLSSAMQVLQHLPKLTSLVLTKNFHGGEIMPMDDIKGFRSIQLFVLASCALSGMIPPWMQSLESLRVLDISRNKLSGKIPPWLGNLNNLFYINLSNNLFSGELPESLTRVKSLISSTYLRENASIEDFEFSIKGLQYNHVSSFPPSLILSSNLLVGPVLPGLGHLVDLHVLDLSWNYFSGHIPDELSNMSSLEVLNFAHNNLTGSIPSSLSKLNFLSRFDVSYNSLIGDIPTGGQFSTFSNEGFVGNAALCLLGNAPCSANAPSVGTGNDGMDTLSATPAMTYITVEVGFTFGLLIVCNVLFFARAWRAAYFLAVDRLFDMLYVMTMVKVNKLRRKWDGKDHP
ncbi:uncharacterized protein [Lolium perenne]|uniref:uncharacterized protein n=1 Tax=Lolium perenne TaxID=4522 RepID=UPI0021E9F79B|nr:phytosulfokine receptor 1-like [Lolium perenne]